MSRPEQADERDDDSHRSLRTVSQSSKRKAQGRSSEHLVGNEQVTLRRRDKQARRSVRDQSPAFARRVRFEEHKSVDEASSDAEEESAPEVHAVEPVHDPGRPQVIHLSSELSEYLRPTDRLRAKVDSNLTMAISLDDPSLKIVHEIRGGWFGLVLFMFGWVNGVVFMMAIVLFGAVVMSPAGDSLGRLAAGTLE
ncbi:hypothetical protein BKA70DRAFT_1436162 [Coprinopsis sp. MPI-PUGE-AT-0042]|nr:hypothetical protein BKA70DRAFT_1446714 [Coprinopsis sp. MPI-PUGE-AT-0042]KAH6901431.1 hypothetical protein BKA70DRAFT_1436162 [Coprinopsis sp. MPI-PUGE-AT-0042]